MNNSEYEVQPFRFWCQKILPLVYDDSLSYYETLCKMGSKINELIDVLNNYQQEYKEYVDNEVEKLKDYVNRQDNIINQKIDFEIEQVYSKHDKDINDLRIEIANVRNELIQMINACENGLAELYDYVVNDQLRQDTLIDIKLKDFYDKIIDLINRVNALIVNPTTGKLDTVQNTINDIYNYLRYEAFTCVEYDGYSKTCEWWDGRQFTAKAFDLYGAKYWGQRLCECRMVNPFTGMVDKITNVISTIISKTTDSLTANEFDVKEYITANYFDTKDLTAYQFDFQGKLYFN